MLLQKNSESTHVEGNRQYDHNALIFDAENEIRVYGDLLENNEKYIFDIELRTLYDNSNWVFSLDGFKAEVIP